LCVSSSCPRDPPSLPPFPTRRSFRSGHAFPGETGFAPGVREQLHRLDVGVAVDDAAGHLRARVGLRLGDDAEARDEVAQQTDIADRKSTRLNFSHVKISYAVFCLKKK